MAKNKKYVYLQLYPKDLLADEKLAKCDKASAWGAYLALLNIMSMEEIRGCVRLRDWDSHPNNERKSLVANFRKANSLRTKAAAFARVVAQCTPLKVGPMAEGIEQLLIFGVIVIHDDALIQPRMFRDSHSVLEGYEPEPEPAEESAEDGVDKGAPAPPKKEKNKEGVARTRTLRANTHTRFESESENNINNSKGNIGGATAKSEENGEKISGAIPVSGCPPTLEDIKAFMHESGEMGRIFRYITAEEYYDDGCKNGWMQSNDRPLYDWKAQLRSFEAYRRNHGDTPIGAQGVRGRSDVQAAGSGRQQGQQTDAAVQATSTHEGKYKKRM